MAAPETATRVVRTEVGEIRLSLVHGRIHLTIKGNGARIPFTTPLDAGRAETVGLELVALAVAARKAAA